MNHSIPIVDIIKNKTLNIIKNKIIIWVVVGILILGLLLFNYNNIKKTPVLETSSCESNDNDYINSMEKKLSNILSSINGVGKCDVMITVDGGKEYVYAIEENVKNDMTISDEKTHTIEETEKKYKSFSEQNKENPLIIKELLPNINGVAIVCEGGNNAAVKNDIINIVGKALGISSDKIAIACKK